MRNRLIELLNEATFGVNENTLADYLKKETIDRVADYLLANGVIVPPCKIGDTVYIIDEADDECGEDYVLSVKVLQFFITEHGIAIDLGMPLGMRINAWMVVGENVFLTKAEAEKALAERSNR